MKITMFIIAALLSVAANATDLVRPQCQTEESRGLRYASKAMYDAAEQSDPWRGCGQGICQMNSNIVDIMRMTQKRFEAEGLADLLKARALEAAHCPDWADAIMENMPVTKDEKEKVKQEFDNRMADEWAQYDRIIDWQKRNPQCEHVDWTYTYIGDKKEDLSGHHDGKPGLCSASSGGKIVPVGTKDLDNLKNWSPDTNKHIAKVACAGALKQFGFGGPTYVEPKWCEQ